jgi:PhnB protein
MPETGLIRGNAVSLVLNPRSEKELENLYQQLSAGGEIMHPLQQTYGGALFGGVTDKFGNNWYLIIKKT